MQNLPMQNLQMQNLQIMIMKYLMLKKKSMMVPTVKNNAPLAL